MIPTSSSGSSIFEPLQQPVELRQTPVTDDSNVVDLAGRVKRWRNIASAVSALAAVLVVMLGLQIFQPNALPQAIRPKPLIQTVEVKVPAPALTPSSQYVALLQGQSGGPAFIMTIDGATKNFTVRKVGAVPEVGKSFELWLISDKLPRPRSLGVIGASDFTARPLLATYDADIINDATYAVTIEQAGGSPDGNPHSSPAFIGKLIETVPPAQK
jgi:anti-sigma-K factor RskA